jgi:hypothetical protein
MSHFVFRLFENLNSEEDSDRFRLEIMVNRGAITNSKEIQQVKDHTIPIKISDYVDISKRLNLEKIDTFLKNLSNPDISKFEQQTGAKQKKPK